MNVITCVLDHLANENKEASPVQKLFCMTVLLALIVLPGLFLLLLLDGPGDETGVKEKGC